MVTILKHTRYFCLKIYLIALKNMAENNTQNLHGTPNHCLGRPFSFSIPILNGLFIDIFVVTLNVHGFLTHFHPFIVAHICVNIVTACSLLFLPSHFKSIYVNIFCLFSTLSFLLVSLINVSIRL